MQIWINLLIFDTDPNTTRIRIWFLLLNKVMQICDHWQTDPPWLSVKPLRLHGSILSLHSNFKADPDPTFDFGVDSDPALHSDQNPDPDSRKDADPDPHNCMQVYI
jgi:hypothetical protein